MHNICDKVSMSLIFHVTSPMKIIQHPLLLLFRRIVRSKTFKRQIVSHLYSHVVPNPAYTSYTTSHLVSIRIFYVCYHIV